MANAESLSRPTDATHAEGGLVRLDTPAQGSAQIVLLLVQQRDLDRVGMVRFEWLDELQAPLEMGGARGSHLAPRKELLETVPANGLQKHQPRCGVEIVRPSHETLVDE
jgi:hypothetical protein